MNRAQIRKTDKHKNKLYDKLAWMYAYLGKTPKPSSEEVIKTYNEKRREWITYCVKNGLTDEAKNLFANEITATCSKRQSEEA